MAKGFFAKGGVHGDSRGQGQGHRRVPRARHDGPGVAGLHRLLSCLLAPQGGVVNHAAFVRH
jgi:hypothetical protein